MTAPDWQIPIRAVSESNAREHWAKKAKRVKAHRGLALVFMRSHSVRPLRPDEKRIVTLVRVAPRPLDDDNLRGAMKATRDGVADAFAIDDRDPRVEWRYEQRRGATRQYHVLVRVEVA